MKIIYPFLIVLSIVQCKSLPKEPIRPNAITKGDFSYAKEKADWRTEVLVQESNLQGLSVLLVDQEKEMFYKGHGVSEEKKPVDKNSKFFIGSVSKVITALLVMKLVEEKKIVLDKPITDYLKNLKLIAREAKDPPPTIRQILYHHGGLPSDIQNGFLTENRIEANANKYRELANQTFYMSEKPGKIMSYSNLGYSLLGCLVEEVSKKSLEEFAREKIFQPLGMNSTSFYYPEMPSVGFKGKKAIPPMYLRDLPAGSVVSNARDMGKLLQLFLNEGMIQGKALFQSSTLKEMRTMQKSSVYDFDFKIGLPLWFANDYIDQMQMVGHGGDVPPYHAYFGFDVHAKLGIVLMTNSFSSSADLEKAAMSIMGEYYEASLGVKPRSNLPKSKPKSVAQEDFQKWEGKYLTPTGWMELKAKEKWLSTNQGIVFVPEKENLFGYEIRLFWELLPISLDVLKQFEVKFTKGEKGEKVFGVTIGNKLLMVHGIETEGNPIVPNWIKRSGKYDIENLKKSLFSDFAIEASEGENLVYLKYRLDLIQSFPLRMAVQVVSEDLGYLASIGRNQGIALAWKTDDKGEYLDFSGYKLRKRK